MLMTICKLSSGQEERVDCVEQAMTELKLCAAEFKSQRVSSSKNWDGSNDIGQCCYHAQMKTCTKRVIIKYCGNDGVSGNSEGTKPLSDSIAESFAISDRREFCSKRSAQELADACDSGVGMFVVIIVAVLVLTVLLMLCCCGAINEWKTQRRRTLAPFSLDLPTSSSH